MGSDNRRILVAAVVSVAILVLWQVIFPAPKANRTAPPPAAPTSPSAPAREAPPEAKAVAPVPAPPPAESASEEVWSIDTPDYRATFSSWGGALKSLALKGEKFRRQVQGAGSEQVDIVHVAPGEVYPLSLAPLSDATQAAGLTVEAAARAPMRMVERDSRSVTFEGRVGTAAVRKRYRVTDRPYEIALDLTIGGERPGELAIIYSGFMPPDAPKPGFFSGGQVFESVVPLCRAGDKTVRFNAKEPAEQVPGTAQWVGLDEHYFVAAVLPQEPMGQCIFAKGPPAGASVAALRLPVEREGKVALTIYAGPKQLDLLRAYGRDLETAIDYGPVTNLFSFFARILLWVMRSFDRVVHNWGAAIILLTIAVKVVLLPLTHKSMQSMQEMRRLQPEIEKLKAKYGDDREKMNLAVMQLYREHKVNPLGGCLPMLIQMPIWLALYATLQTSVELYREPFLWIRDLTAHDPYYVLPLAMGLSMFLMQKISPQPADNAQAKMLLYFMPIFFTFIMLRLPAGLTLYILINNVLSIGQQQMLMRRQPQPAPAKA